MPKLMAVLTFAINLGLSHVTINGDLMVIKTIYGDLIVIEWRFVLLYVFGMFDSRNLPVANHPVRHSNSCPENLTL